MSSRATTNISTKGQVVLPKAVRDELGWRPGDKLVVERQSKSVVMRLAEDETHTRFEDVRGSLGKPKRRLTSEQADLAFREAVRRRWARKSLADD